MKKLTYDSEKFYLDGEEYRILSGTIHYFRVPEEYWVDRLTKLKNCGFNTVETYTCWNLHERQEGNFDFSGNLNLSKFIKTADDLGLNVILRPGPYICAEWDWGGLPSWLLTYDKMKLRCYDETFISKVERYYTALFEQIRPHFASNGGNVIAVQIENEYGSYGTDKRYLNEIVNIYKKNNLDCFFFTSDGASHLMLGGGTLDGYLATANFGSNPKKNFAALKDFRKDQPLMCCEFWNGWFDHWYEEHHVRDSSSTIENFKEMLDMGASVNFYMFHGGTNFAFWNGANFDEKYTPTVTSYDYDAPLSEAGDMTDKYYAIKEAIEDFTGVKQNLDVRNSEKAAYGKLPLNEYASLFDNLDNLTEKVESVMPLNMEEVGQDFGYILYRKEIKGPLYDEEYHLNIDNVHDRALIFVDGEYKGKIERGINYKDDVIISVQDGLTIRLDILVENMGRVNYGRKIIGEKKGILGCVRLNNTFLCDWEIYPLTFDDISKLEYKSERVSSPAFYKGVLNIDKPCDTFIKPENFEKGFIMVNGHNIGRFFNSAGPQKTLYIPAVYLREGENIIEIFESDKVDEALVTFTDKPEI